MYPIGNDPKHLTGKTIRQSFEPNSADFALNLKMPPPDGWISIKDMQ